MIARSGVNGGRKVRAPQGRVVRNADGSVSQETEYGKCHRKDTVPHVAG